jgi:hypothetical protein
MHVLPPDIQANLAKAGRRDDFSRVITIWDECPRLAIRVKLVMREVKCCKASSPQMEERHGDYDAITAKELRFNLAIVLPAIRKRRGEVEGLTCRWGGPIKEKTPIENIKGLITSWEERAVVGTTRP